MNRAPHLRIGAALLAALALNGCIAAAIPVLAGGAVLRSETDGERGFEVADDTAELAVAEPLDNPTVAVGDNPPSIARPSVDEAFADETVADESELIAANSDIVTEASGAAILGSMIPAEPELVAGPTLEPVAPEPETTAEAAAAPSENFDVAFGAPASRDELLETTRPEIAPGGYDSFLAYAVRLETFQPRRNPYPSALLSNPGDLTGERKSCPDGRTPIVLIDLDPADGVFDPAKALTVDRSLAEGIQTLRENGISIAWISGRSADSAGAIRRLLSISGLDLSGEDTLLLMRYVADRKQSRREELAQTGCIIAIAGDTRSDFDELFDYLKETSSAAAVESLIEDGWFLTPLALSQGAIADK